MFDDHARVRASDILESDKWKLLSEMKSHEEKKEKKLKIQNQQESDNRSEGKRRF